MKALWTTWRRESAAHPSVLALTIAALLGLSLGGVFVLAGMALLGQLIAGLAVAPLSLAVYLCLLPAALGCSQPLGPRRDRVPGRLPHGRIGLSPPLGGRTLTDGNRWHGPVDLLAVGG